MTNTERTGDDASRGKEKKEGRDGVAKRSGDRGQWKELFKTQWRVERTNSTALTDGSHAVNGKDGVMEKKEGPWVEEEMGQGSRDGFQIPDRDTFKNTLKVWLCVSTINNSIMVCKCKYVFNSLNSHRRHNLVRTSEKKKKILFWSHIHDVWWNSFSALDSILFWGAVGSHCVAPREPDPDLH